MKYRSSVCSNLMKDNGEEEYRVTMVRVGTVVGENRADKIVTELRRR